MAKRLNFHETLIIKTLLYCEKQHFLEKHIHTQALFLKFLLVTAFFFHRCIRYKKSEIFRSVQALSVLPLISTPLTPSQSLMGHYNY